MKLLFISNLFPSRDEPYRGLDNACILHALRPLGVECRAVALRPTLPPKRKSWSPRDEDAPFAPVFLPVPYVPKLGGFANHLLTGRTLASLDVSDFHPDVVLAAWIFPDACAAIPWATQKSIPIVALAQGSDVHTYLRSPLRRRVITSRLPNAKAVITRSADLARRLAQIGMPAQRLHPVINGVDDTVFHPGHSADARARLGLPSEGHLVLYVGNFYPVKNPLGAVAAMREVPGATLVMVGGGPLEARAKAIAGNRVIFAGRRKAAEVADFMRACDALVLPSLNEGVPNVILESVHSGLPVVATRVGGIEEIISDPALGTLVPPGDPSALAGALRERLKTKANPAVFAEHASRYTWARAAREYLQILEAATSR